MQSDSSLHDGIRTGLAVMRVIKEEGLQQSAAAVGAHLRIRLEALQGGRPYIGDVRGLGLMLGIEIVSDSSLTHAPALAHWIKVSLCCPFVENTISSRLCLTAV